MKVTDYYEYTNSLDNEDENIKEDLEGFTEEDLDLSDLDINIEDDDLDYDDYDNDNEEENDVDSDFDDLEDFDF